MKEENFSQEAPRILEVVVGIILGAMSLFFSFVTLYFGYAALQRGIIELAFTAMLFGISYFLGRWAIKLVKGSSGRKDDYLISNFALSFWGVVFGISGAVGLLDIIYYKHLGLIEEVIILATLSVGSYLTLKTRTK